MVVVQLLCCVAGVLTSNEQVELFCKIDGWELGGMHFGVLAQVQF